MGRAPEFRHISSQPIASPLFFKRIEFRIRWLYECVRYPNRKVEQMLKISYSGTAREQRWTLCGQLSGPWVDELFSTWERGRVELNGRTCVVDLSEVTSLDERGEKLLRTMKENGVRFVARGVDMRHILSHLRSKAKPSLRRSLAHLDCDFVVPESRKEK